MFWQYVAYGMMIIGVIGLILGICAFANVVPFLSEHNILYGAGCAIVGTLLIMFGYRFKHHLQRGESLVPYLRLHKLSAMDRIDFDKSI